MWIHAAGSTVEVWTPAKLNLFLEVLSKRADGYHEIETLMVPVSLYDGLHFSTNEPEYATTERATNASAIAFSGRWASDVWRGDGDAAEQDGSNEHPIPQGAENLVVKAVELLRRRAGTDAGATIRLVKRIPMAAGLGGGSSDAAAALVAANLAWRLRYSTRELMPLAAEVGSDVPFFLTRSAAICRGRGERVEPLELHAACHFVIVQPPEGLATAGVYRQCRPANSPRLAASLVEAFQRGDVVAAGRELHNALQPPAERLSPWIGRMKQHFAQLGFAGHQMSGSGTSYFGLSPTAGHARPRPPGSAAWAGTTSTRCEVACESPPGRRRDVDITEVRIKLTEDLGERLKAFCSITFDNCFVVRDLKIIEGANGPFVAMPSRKLTFHCPECRSKNHLRASYCNQCGRSLKEHQPAADAEGRIKLYADIAHPINSQCRELIQDRVISAFQQETEVAKQPGYVSHYDDYDDDWAYDAPVERIDSATTTARPKLTPGVERANSGEAPRGPHKKPEIKVPRAVAGGTPRRSEPPDNFGAGIF